MWKDLIGNRIPCREMKCQTFQSASPPDRKLLTISGGLVFIIAYARYVID